MKRVDHLIVRTPSAEPLFALFTQQLQLPEAWPLTLNSLYTTGAVHLGNLNLEFRQFRTGGRVGPILPMAGLLRPEGSNTGGVPITSRTRLYGLGFELQPFERSLPALAERNIPHTPPMPFFQVDDQGWQMTTWTNVFLGGLLGDSTARRMFFASSQRVPKDTWERGSLPSAASRSYGLPYIYQRVFPRSLAYGVEYNPVWRAKNVHEQLPHTGLDVLRVFELAVGVRNLETARACWKALLEGYPEVAPDVWRLPGDLHIRLVPHQHNELLGMLWQVASLNRAAQFLHRQGMLYEDETQGVMIDPRHVQGLSIRLIA